MRASYAWLSELVPGLPPAEALAERLLHLGLEVSSLTRVGPAFTGVVVGEVVTKDKHPNADRLSVCTVTDGAATYPVVCGAPNVAAGQRVAFAKVGAVLGPDLKIKKSKIRGAVSEGMICSASELGLPEGGADGILVLGPGAALGTDFAAALGPGDALLEVEVTPNRPDCLSHRGLARELLVHYGLAWRAAPPAPRLPEGGPACPEFSVADAADCPMYQGRLVSGVAVAPSPEPLRRRLEACGLKPINNVVDASNLLLLEHGQPTHAFDADKLSGPVAVRRARAGERLKALDGKEYALGPEDLVIADGSGPVAIAGVIGGLPTAVTDATRNVFLEVARFHPGRVRRTARRLGLRTDSSVRFERGLDPALQTAAAGLLAASVVGLAGGSAGPVRRSAPDPAAPPDIATTAEGLNAILGTSHPEAAVRAVLGRISAKPLSGPGLTLSVPSYRLDLASPEDLAEEVARHLGYDAIPEEAAPARLPVPSELPVPALAERLSDALAGLGFCEAFNYDFLSEPELERLGSPRGLARLLNPISEDWAALRPTLLGGLLRNAATNSNRGAAGGRLFEAGKVYRQEGRVLAESPRLAGLWFGPWPGRAHFARRAAAPTALELKGLLEALLRRHPVSWAAASDPLFSPRSALNVLAGGKPAGTLGELHPELLRRWGLRGPAAAFELDLDALAAAPAAPPRYEAVSAFPAVTRDLSLSADRALPFARLAELLTFPPLAALDLVDLYEGDKLPAGKKSWLVRLTLQLPDRTLTDADIDAAMAKVQTALKSADVSPRA